MSLSKKRERELKKAATAATDEINFLMHSKGAFMRFDTNWYSFLSYLSSENLVKHSKRLTRLTIGLIVIGAGMIGLAITQLVVFLG